MLSIFFHLSIVALMLWGLYGEKAGQLCRSWNTSVKTAWGLPRSTHTFIVENFLAREFSTVKQQLVGRYVNFFRGLLLSMSPKVKVLPHIVGRCARSNTGKNLMQIERETSLDPWVTASWKIVAAVPRSEVPDQEKWRLAYLMKLIAARQQMESSCEDTCEINALIESLCSS